MEIGVIFAMKILRNDGEECQMNKLFLVSVLLSMPSFTMMAQDDDLYFVPKKTVETNHSVIDRLDRSTYYIGSDRNIDEYNHRGKFRSRYGRIDSDSLSDGMIGYRNGRAIYPDTIYEDENDYAYCRRMSRFDGYYGWYDPWFYGHWGYGPYWSARWGWYDPWYYGYYGYAGWDYPWRDPWYYGYYGYRWRNPYYYGWGWDYPYYPSRYVVQRGITGTRNHSDGVSPRIEGRRDFTFGNGNRTRSFGSRNSNSSWNRQENDGFVNSIRSRSYDNNMPSRSYTPMNSGRSFGGGNRSFGGGGNSGGGGGHFGNGRR